MKTRAFTATIGGTLLSGCGSASPGGRSIKETNTMTCCSSGPATCCPAPAADGAAAATAARRPLEVEFLFLDLTLCDRCRGTEKALADAVADAGRILEPIGIDVTLKSTQVTTPEQARQLAFVSSPTIRVMGRDAAIDVRENFCAGCSSLCGSDISCRVWTWQGRPYSVPPKELLLDAILRDAYLHPSGTREVPPPFDALPENLERFFGAASKSRAAPARSASGT